MDSLKESRAPRPTPHFSTSASTANAESRSWAWRNTGQYSLRYFQVEQITAQLTRMTLRPRDRSRLTWLEGPSTTARAASQRTSATSGESYAGGEVVARTTTDADGTYRVAVAPGEYVVTADAGMSCELMDARVTASTYSKVDIPCGTGIR